MNAPRRLLDEAALAARLRGDLERTVASPCAYDSAAGLAALQLALGASVVAVAGGAVPAAASAPSTGAAAAAAPAVKSAALLGAAGAKVGVGAMAATVAVVIASVLVTSEASLPRRSNARTVTTAAPAATLDESEVARVAVPPVQELPARASVPEPSASAQFAPARAHATGDRARREIVQLGRVKVLLARDPARAYAAAQSGHREFPRGVLRHEREGLAVLALFALDRRAEAEVRARAFLERYPSSPLRAQIEQRRRAP